MADTRYIIRQEHGGETRVIGDGALPFFLNQGFVVVGTVDAPPASAQVALPVIHGADADALRPDTDQPVVWYGDVTPTNLDAARRDEWASASGGGGRVRSSEARPITVANRVAPVQAVPFSTTQTSRVPYLVAVSAGNIQVEFSHHYQTDGAPYGDTAPAGSIDLRVGVEINGVIYRATFAGRTTVTIDPGGVVRSDPVGVEVAAGDVIFVRTYLASGTTYGNRTNYNNPGGRYTGSVAGGGGTAAGDLTAPGSAAISDSEANLFGPAVVYGASASLLPPVIGSGDSILAGQGDSNDVGGHIDNNNAGGWFERAFVGKRGVISVAKASEQAAQFVVPANHRIRSRYFTPGSWVICAYGRNDMSLTESAIKTALLQHWGIVAARGARAAQTTITPESTSTDNWATTGNQTTASNNAKRVPVNDWLRDGAPILNGAPAATGSSAPGTLRTGDAGHPLSLLIETADAVETARNSGIWKAGYTYDGLHPMPPGHIAMAAAVPMDDLA